MKRLQLIITSFCIPALVLAPLLILQAEDKAAPKRAFIDGTGPGWVTLQEKDFVDVNGDENTWKFDGAYVTGSGTPIGVNRTVKTYKNFEKLAKT